MGFCALYYLFDNQFSANYKMRITNINGGGVENSSAGANVNLLNSAVYRKPTRYNYGVSYGEVLTFTMTVMSEQPLLGYFRTKVENWMFQRMSYKKLQIVQNDLQNIFFNCFLLEPEAIYVGNMCYGFTFTVECDAPWAWEYPKTFNYENPNNLNSQEMLLYNDSDNNDYTYPLLEIKAGLSGGQISIINKNENRVTAFKNVVPEELITVDNSHHIIKSSVKDYIGNDFNAVFFRLLPSTNSLQILGNIDYVKIIYNNARKVGG